MNEREQEKIDAKLATSGEERSEKQQSKKASTEQRRTGRRR